MTERRSWPARIGIVLMNLPAPGLGLLRTGRWRLAVACLAAGPVYLAVLTALAWVAPRASAGAVAAALIGAALVALGTVLTSTVVSWRSSGRRLRPLAWWSRWYALVGALVAVLAANVAASVASETAYKAYSMSSAAMMPTLAMGDVMLVDMRRTEPVGRGDIVVFAAPTGADYVMRVIGLPGDRIEVAGGVPIINGRPVRQTRTGERMLITDLGVTTDIAQETAPGRDGPYRVMDAGPTQGDDYRERRVPADHVFVMGDNRDFSADSRFAPEENGAGFVPISAIRGEAYMLRNFDQRFGRRLDR